MWASDTGASELRISRMYIVHTHSTLWYSYCGRKIRRKKKCSLERFLSKAKCTHMSAEKKKVTEKPNQAGST